jgi:hypothetical protein
MRNGVVLDDCTGDRISFIGGVIPNALELVAGRLSGPRSG